LIPFEYILDNQGGIRNPYGMIGTRLEIRANVISALTPDVENLNQLCIGAGNLAMHEVVPAAEAAATAIITNRQRENGIGVVNFGGATTSIAIYDEGELQYTSVIPMGSNDITRDLATILAATPDLAEDVKLRHADGQFKDGKDVTLTHGRDQYVFSRSEINEVVEARLDEIFEEVHNRLIASGYDKRLPEGLILTGGGAKMRNLDLYVRSKLSMAVRMGEVLPGITATDKNILKSDYTTAIGLMLRDMEAREYNENSRRSRKRHKNSGSGGNIFSKFMGFFH
jgi:cell division protein FtsA